MIGRELLTTEILKAGFGKPVELDLEFALPNPPTPDEIAERTALIRDGWSENIRQEQNEQAWQP